MTMVHGRLRQAARTNTLKTTTHFHARGKFAMKHFVIVLLLASGLMRPALAESDLEIITLNHRTVEEVIPALLPLLEPEGVLTGLNGQLILRASTANRIQIRQALRALDMPLRQLSITVRQGMQSSLDRHTAEIHGRIESAQASVSIPSTGSGGLHVGGDTGKVRVGARLDDREMDRFSRVTQRVRVVDGAQAFILAGIRLPMTQREVIWGPYGQTVKESMVYLDMDSGFYVQPQIVGERVNIEINPVQQSFSAAGPYVVMGQEMRTSLSGRLGEWIELGESNDLRTQEDRQTGGQSVSSQTRASQVWLKVEAMD